MYTLPYYTNKEEISMAKGKVQKRITFDLENHLEEELFEELNKYTGAGVDLLIDHYQGFKENSGGSEYSEVEIDLIDEEIEEWMDTEEEEEDEVVLENEDPYKELLGKYIDDMQLLLDKAALAEKESDDFILHIVNGEILTEREYKLRVWRPHHELSHNKREAISTDLYNTEDPEQKRAKSLEMSKRYSQNGTQRSRSEIRQHNNEKRKMNILDTIMNTDE